MDWEILAIEDATAFLDHIRSREPARLADLAQLLARDGLLDAMDGSVASLEPLWIWWLGQQDQDFPGVPVRQSSLQIFWRRQWPSDVARAQYAVEPLAHYLALVLRGADPSYSWDFIPLRPKKNVSSPQVHSTVLVNAEKVWSDPLTLCRGIAFPHDDAFNESYRRAPERLVVPLARLELPPAKRLLPLADYLDRRVPDDDPSRLAPTAGPTRERDLPMPAVIGSSLEVLWPAGRSLEPLAQLLRDTGWAAEVATVENLDAEIDLDRDDSVALAYLIEGPPGHRSLVVELLAATDDQARWIEARIRGFALQHRVMVHENAS